MFTLQESRDQIRLLDMMARTKIESFPKRIQEFTERIKTNEVGKYDIGKMGVLYDEFEAAKEIRGLIEVFFKEEVIDLQKAMDNFLDRMDYGMRYALEKQNNHAKMVYYMKMNHFVRGGIPID
jgi:viroplasmin and RNaseH domain-containing protein